MKRTGCLLAEMPGFGSVYDCGNCGGIHVRIGPVDVTLAPDAYMQFVTLIHSSAANFETWLHTRGTANDDEPVQEDRHADRDNLPPAL